MHVSIQLLCNLGFSISYDKVEGSATGVTFLGMVVDSVSFTLELPQQKLTEFMLSYYNLQCASALAFTNYSSSQPA